MPVFVRPCLLAFSALLALGCYSVPKDLASENTKRLQSWNAAIKVAQENKAAKKVSWQEALNLMLAHHPDLQRAKLDRVNAKRDAKEAWEQLLPFISVQANRSVLIGNASDLLDISTTTFSVNVFLYLERFAQLPRTLYGVALSKARADMAWRVAVKVHELDLFSRCETLAAVQQSAIRAQALDELMARHPVYFLGKDRDAQHLARREFDEKIRNAKNAMHDTLGIQYEDIEVDAASLPVWPEAGEKLLKEGLPQEGNATFVPDPDWIGLMAMEGVGMIARKRGIWLGAWPSISVYLSLPSTTYTPGSGLANTDFSQTTINPNIYWSPNFLLDLNNQMERIEDEEKLLKESFETQIHKHLRDMDNQARVLREAQIHLDELDKRIAGARLVATQLPPTEAALLGERSLRWQAEREEVLHARRIGLVQLWFLSDNNKEVLPYEKPE